MKEQHRIRYSERIALPRRSPPIPPHSAPLRGAVHTACTAVVYDPKYTHSLTRGSLPPHSLTVTHSLSITHCQSLTHSQIDHHRLIVSAPSLRRCVATSFVRSFTHSHSLSLTVFVRSFVRSFVVALRCCVVYFLSSSSLSLSLSSLSLSLSLSSLSLSLLCGGCSVVVLCLVLVAAAGVKGLSFRLLIKRSAVRLRVKCRPWRRKHVVPRAERAYTRPIVRCSLSSWRFARWLSKGPYAIAPNCALTAFAPPQ